MPGDHCNICVVTSNHMHALQNGTPAWRMAKEQRLEERSLHYVSNGDWDSAGMRLQGASAQPSPTQDCSVVAARA